MSGRSLLSMDGLLEHYGEWMDGLSSGSRLFTRADEQWIKNPSFYCCLFDWQKFHLSHINGYRKVFLQPNVYHHMVLEHITISSLNEINETVRRFVVSTAKRYAYRTFPRSSDQKRTGNFVSHMNGLLQKWKRLLAMLLHHEIGEVKDSYLVHEKTYVGRWQC